MGENSLNNSLGFQLMKTARSMKRAFDMKSSQYGLTSSQYAVLARLWEENGLSLSELSKRLYFDGPTITGIVDRMERDRLVERERDGEDRRVIKIYLTENGKKLKKRLCALGDEIDKKAIAHFSEDEIRGFKEILDRIWINIENGC
ncbi:MarR family transcriptional regulator [candidate division KSB1 bacterium]|nr:MarR family transcriptional regulator [candidate division KSB1 bacterium]